MVEILCPRYELFRILDAVNNIANEAKIVITNNTLKTRVINQTHVIALIAEMSVITEEPNNLEIGLTNIHSIVKFLKSVKTENVMLKIDKESGQLHIITETKNFTCDITDPEFIFSYYTSKIDTNSYAEFSTKGKVLKDLVKYIKPVSNIVTLESKNWLLRAIASNDEPYDNLRAKTSNNKVSVEIKLGILRKDVKVSYNIKYLELIAKSLKKNDSITLKFDTNKPLVVHVNSPTIMFYLAPF